MRADNSHHVIASARRRAERTRERALAALRRLDATGQAINFDTLAREAGVSRSWLYTQDDLRAEIERLRERHGPTRSPATIPDRQRASEASLLRRLEAATTRIRTLHNENQQLRDALAKALGDRRTTDIHGEHHDHDTPKRSTTKTISPC
jgi:DNA-binding XRE family transcriptional regulator